jgi:hypothetical protein
VSASSPTLDVSTIGRPSALVRSGLVILWANTVSGGAQVSVRQTFEVS